MPLSISSVSSGPPIEPCTVHATVPKSDLERRIDGYWNEFIASKKSDYALKTDYALLTSTFSSYLSLNHKKEETIQQIRQICSTILAHTSKKKSEEDLRQEALLEREQLFASWLLEKKELNYKTDFKCKENRALFRKWITAGLDPLAFICNPSASSFIFDAHLLQSSSYWGHEVRSDPNTHQLSVMVEGKYQPLEPIAQKLTTRQKKFFWGKDNRITEKANPEKTWCYLPKRGLCPWQETRWTKITPCATLTPDEVQRAASLAKLSSEDFKNNPEKEPYVLEIVSSLLEPSSNVFNSGFQRNFKSPRHPWIRIITPQGDFYSVGFNLGAAIRLPGELSKGIFRSPDPWETMPHAFRQITGVKITKKDFEEICRLINESQSESVDFHFLEHNCTRFLQSVVSTLGIDKKKPGKHVRFYASISELFLRAQPKFIQNAYTKTGPARRFIKEFVSSISPPFLVKAFQVILNTCKVITERSLLAISGRGFNYIDNQQLPDFKKQDPHSGIPAWKILTHAEIATRSALVRAFLPVRVLEWQMRLQAQDSQTNTEEPATRVIKFGNGFTSQYPERVSREDYKHVCDMLDIQGKPLKLE